MKNRVVEIDEIKTILPHRYPFLFVDRITEIDGDIIRGIKNVTVNEDFFNGHFPDFPVMPGVLIIEALAQVCGIYGILKLKEENRYDEKQKTFFTSINNVKFKRLVRPGDQLVFECKYIKDKMMIWWFECRALVDGEEAAVADLSAAFR
ncbi:MAG: 3-hydroxyacyl-ACP dehydratase FabZ [Mucispirillum sp.]|nr:3-hydroxyacyl-ACP dehydratase FabZ [Mucispirillum sp.]